MVDNRVTRKPVIRNIYSVLLRIDRRLEIAAKYVGYVTVLGGAVLFLLSSFGVDVKEFIMGPEPTVLQKERRAEIRLSGFSADMSGVWAALLRNDDVILKYLNAGLIPDKSVIQSVTKDKLGREPLPKGLLLAISFFEARFPELMSPLAQFKSQAEVVGNAVVEFASRGIDVEQFCKRINSKELTFKLSEKLQKTEYLCLSALASDGAYEEIDAAVNQFHRLSPLSWHPPEISRLMFLSVLPPAAGAVIPVTKDNVGQVFDQPNRVYRIRERLSFNRNEIMIRGGGTSKVRLVRKHVNGGAIYTWDCSNSFCEMDLAIANLDGSNVVVFSYDENGKR